VWHPQSRVVALSGLAGRWIAPTQLWSILFNLALGPVLITAWLTRAVPVTVIVGLYFALTGIERFAEDAWRGETQTRTLGGLKEPQWLALLSIAGGIAVSCVPSPPPAPAADPLAVAAALTALIAGVFTALAMSVDFPRSSARFSRLSG
jgi:phosphatidylglycerol:prolipoprotein diacylglycerol transferase